MTRLATLMRGRESSDSLPAEARELLSRRTCSLVDACHFLGLPTKTDSRGEREQAGTSATRRAKAYITRTDADLSRYLVPMMWPEIGWPE